MQRHRPLLLAGLLLTAICGLTGARALAASGPTITATGFTMPSSGNGTSQFTVTGFPGDGTVIIGCVYAGTNIEAKIPYCLSGASTASVPVTYIPVTAGQTLTGTVTFYPYGTVDHLPLGLRKAPRNSHLPAAGLALAGAFLLGFGLRRKAPRWLAMGLLAAGALAGASAIGGCGGLSTAMTPGSYPYTITANYQDTATPILSAILEANIVVTVQ